MPNKDGTGPRGLGPMGGKAMGRCGQRRGFGNGFGNRFENLFQEMMTLDKDEQKKILEAQLKEIDSNKMAIENKIKELS